jgi:hypothetical protein
MTQRIKPGRFGLFTKQTLYLYLEKHHPVESTNFPEVRYDQETQLFKLTERPVSSAETLKPVTITEREGATLKPAGIKKIVTDSVRSTTEKFMQLEKEDFGKNTQKCKNCKRVGRLNNGICGVCPFENL